MRINRTVATSMGIAMLASLSLTACGEDEIKSVTIGNQTWMAENLNIAIEGSKCYENKEENCKKYGRLYNWETALKACPQGWHLPSYEEWDVLYHYADGTNGTEGLYESTTAGKLLKAKNDWNGSGNGEDKFGFSALPGGIGNNDGSFANIGNFGYWWSSNPLDEASTGMKNAAHSRVLLYNNDAASFIPAFKNAFASVRCIKGDAKPAATEQAKAPEQPKKSATTSSAEEVASLYVTAGVKMDIETMKKITTGTALEKMLAMESTMKLTASSKGQSYEEFTKELQAEFASKGEQLVIKSATKVSDDGKFARVIVYAGKKGDDLEVPTAIILAKQGGEWKVMDTPKQ